MAKEEETNDTPAFIDYGGFSTEGEDSWRASDYQAYWRKLMMKHHSTSAPTLTIAQQGMLSRMMKQFDQTTLKRMMERWVSTKPIAQAMWFPYFYKERLNMLASVTAKDYGWDD